jgi:hypothetical protein
VSHQRVRYGLKREVKSIRSKGLRSNPCVCAWVRHDTHRFTYTHSVSNTLSAHSAMSFLKQYEEDAVSWHLLALRARGRSRLLIGFLKIRMQIPAFAPAEIDGDA